MSFLYKYCYVGKGISVHKPHVVFVVIHQHFRAVTHKKGVETRFHSFLADRLSLYNPWADYAYNLVAGLCTALHLKKLLSIFGLVAWSHDILSSRR